MSRYEEEELEEEEVDLKGSQLLTIDEAMKLAGGKQDYWRDTREAQTTTKKRDYKAEEKPYKHMNIQRELIPNTDFECK